MGVTILVCSCGQRLKGEGLAPGKRGRCPRCGTWIRVPDAEPGSELLPPPPVEQEEREEDEWNWRGTYDVGEAMRPLPLRPLGAEPGIRTPAEPLPAPETDPVPERPRGRSANDLMMEFDPGLVMDGPAVPVPSTVPASEPDPDRPDEDDEWNWHGTNYNLGQEYSSPAPTASELGPGNEVEGPLPVGWPSKQKPQEAKPLEPEAWFPPRLLYPLRGAEGISMAVIIGLAFWAIAVLVPAYCLTIQADAELFGASTLGYLIALISALPAVLLMPFVLVYWLQYLGRVLTAAYDGEPLPPRPPDRNFDGLLNGVSSWLLWLALGLGVGFLPVVGYWTAATEGLLSWNPMVAIALALLGFPYALSSLAMIQLHDDPLDARPGQILLGTVRSPLSFLGLCLTIASLVAPTVGTLAVAYSARARSAWLMVAIGLAGWLLAAWISIVVMYTLGAYYGTHDPRKQKLRLKLKRQAARAAAATPDSECPGSAWDDQNLGANAPPGEPRV